MTFGRLANDARPFDQGAPSRLDAPYRDAGLDGFGGAPIAQAKAPSSLEGAPAPQARDGGAPLDGDIRGRMESSFGTSFADVRVHQDGGAERLGATAYTVGSDLHFASGAYQPGTQPGAALIGHELTHVQQQRAGASAVPQGKDAPINADPALEAEADEVGARAAAGESVSVTGVAGAALGQPVQAKTETGDDPQPRESVLASAMQDLLLPAQHASRSEIAGMVNRFDALVATAADGIPEERKELTRVQFWLHVLLQLPVYDDSTKLLGAASTQIERAATVTDKRAKLDTAMARLERAKDARLESDVTTTAKARAEDAKVSRNEKRVATREKKADKAGQRAQKAQAKFKTRYEAYNDWLAEQPVAATLNAAAAAMDASAWGPSARGNRLDRVLERIRLSYTIKGHGAWRAEEQIVSVGGIGAGHAVDVKANDLGLLGARDRSDRSERARELRMDQPEEEATQGEATQGEEAAVSDGPTPEASPPDLSPALADMSDADVDELHEYLNSPDQFEQFRQQLMLKLMADNKQMTPEMLADYHDAGENFTGTGACYQGGVLMTKRLKQMGRKGQTKQAYSKEEIPGLGMHKDHVWTLLDDGKTVVDGTWKQFWKPVQREGHDPEPTADDWVILNALPNVFTGTQEQLHQLVLSFNHKLSKPFSDDYIESIIALYDPLTEKAKYLY